MSKDRLKSLLAAVAGIDRVFILPHNDPDPDAIAGALAMRYLLNERTDIETQVVYNGLIERAENKALVNYLGWPLQPLTSLDTPPLTSVALIDTQPCAGNNILPAESEVALVIDHHPRCEPVPSAKFTDIRTEVGATSTILLEYLQAAGLEPDQQLATAMFYGIKTDTMGLSREAGPADVAAYHYLQPRIDFDALIEIERAQVPIAYFKSFDNALRAAKIYDHTVVTYVGAMDYPDLAAETADLLLRLEGSEWVICMGVFEDNLLLSIRTRNRKGGAGKLAQAVVGNQGIAGGHGSMAGGQIPLNGREPKQLAGRIRHRALQHLNIPSKVKAQSLV
jgi:nanoRNase/pAp phosphatase (c-di-AMP/oligoRNAs hydrolase)